MQKIKILLRIVLYLLCIGMLLWGFGVLRRCKQGSDNLAWPSLSGGIFAQETHGPSPTQIRSIERIGEWEFLSIEDEEIVDTVRRRLMLPDQYLVRIYKGTMRLGIDLSQAPKDWVEMNGDTVCVTLPQVKLLNSHFIDEARTQTFHETGEWNAQAKEEMYHKARRKMMQRGLSETHLKQAYEVGKCRMEDVFRALGFAHVVVK